MSSADLSGLPGRSNREAVRARALAGRVRSAMSAASNPERAIGMQAYMKSTMPYHGIQSAGVRAICAEVFDAHPVESCREWRAAILELWRHAHFREERYAAINLVGQKRHRKCWTPQVMPMIEEMMTTGAWWDYVDALAGVVGGLLRRYPDQIRPVVRGWSTDPNIWKRRVSIICQLAFKQDTDLELLYANIEPNLADPEFFIRKAIGWALRQYARTDPDEVARYVRLNESRLSGLSRREALKNI